MGNLYCALQPKGGRDLRLIQISGELQANLGPRFELMDEQFYEGVDEFIPFDGGYSPDPNQMLYMALTEEMNELAAQMDAGAIGRDRYDPTEHHPDDIRALFWCYERDGHSRILVQNFTRAQAVSRRGVLLSWLDGETFQRLEAPSILLGEKIDGVIWHQRIEFKSFFVAKQVFDLREAYREATHQEVEAFLALPSILPENEDVIENLNATQRKLIFSINKAEIFDELTVDQLRGRAEQEGFDLPMENGRILISSGKELTHTLRFLDNGVYRSPINDQLYVSNSHRLVARGR